MHCIGFLLNSCSWVVVTRKGRWRVGELAWAHLNIAFPTIRWWSVSWLGHTPLYSGFLSCCPQICVNRNWFFFNCEREKMHAKWKVGLGCCWPFHQCVDNNITSTFLDLGVKCEKIYVKCIHMIEVFISSILFKECHPIFVLTQFFWNTFLSSCRSSSLSSAPCDNTRERVCRPQAILACRLIKTIVICCYISSTVASLKLVQE